MQPLPLDPTTTMETVAAAIRTAGGSLPADAGSALLQGWSILVTPTPMEDATALAIAWMTMTEHRPDHPLAGVRIVAADVDQVASLRRRGFDAVTAFAHGRAADGLHGIGLVVVMDTASLPEDDLARVFDAAFGVRIVVLNAASGKSDDDRRPTS